MQQIDANTKMKHPNKVLPTISSKFPVNTRRVCFPIESFVQCNTESFGPVCQLWSVTHKCMRDSKPQRFVLQHKSLKVTQIATNRGKHINEAWKKFCSQSLPNIMSLINELMLYTRKLCFPIGRFVSMSSIYELKTKFFLIRMQLMKLYKERPELTSQFDVSKVQKTTFKCNTGSFGPVC